MSGKEEEKKRKKRLKDKQDRAGKKVAGDVTQPEQAELGHLNPLWREFYLRVIDNLEER